MELDQHKSPIQADEGSSYNLGDKDVKKDKDKRELLIVLNEIIKASRYIAIRLKKARADGIQQGFLFAIIALILSLICSLGLAYLMEDANIVFKVLGMIEDTQISYDIINEIYNPVLVAYNLLYGGDIQARFIFNSIDTYCFSVMPPLFFAIITVVILGISEKIRYRISGKKRDMYSNIYIACINSIVVLGCGLILTHQTIMDRAGIELLMNNSQMGSLYRSYISYSSTPTLRIISSIDITRLVGMSFIITIFTLTFCVNKHLIFENYKKVKSSVVYIMRMLLIAVIVISVVAMIKIITLKGYPGIPEIMDKYYLLGFIFIMGVLVSALTTGNLSFINYTLDSNVLMRMDMGIFSIDSNINRNLFQLDNPIGGYYLVLVILILGMISMAGCIHFMGKNTKFIKGFKESLAVATIVSLSIGLLSKLGCMSFRIMCDITSKTTKYSSLEMGLGSNDFWIVTRRVFVITLCLFFFGWACNQLCSKTISFLGELASARASIILWVGLVAIVAVTIAIIIEPSVIEEVYELYNTSKGASTENAIIQFKELFR